GGEVTKPRDEIRNEGIAQIAVRGIEDEHADGCATLGPQPAGIGITSVAQSLDFTQDARPGLDANFTQLAIDDIGNCHWRHPGSTRDIADCYRFSLIHYPLPGIDAVSLNSTAAGNAL